MLGMSVSSIFPILAVTCWIIAILFFRKENISLNKVLFPFMASLYSSSRMKEDLQTEGVWLIAIGYISLVIYMLIKLLT